VVKNVTSRPTMAHWVSHYGDGMPKATQAFAEQRIDYGPRATGRGFALTWRAVRLPGL
jgi:hypothetical protein